MKSLLVAAVMLIGGSAFALEGGADPFAGGNAEAGAGKAAVCGACHGPVGNSSNPEWPKLAGQHASYIVAQLKMLKSGERKSPVMMAQVASLSEPDMKDLAAFFSSQQMQPGVASPAAVKTAEAIYRDGDSKRALPACAACHGPQGHGNAAAGYPRIGGQHSAYAAIALRAYRDPARAASAHPNTATMAAVAAKLSESEVDALASYINGLQ